MHVLLVEDDVPTARTQEQALETRGYTSQATGLGEDAVDLARKQDYDIILLDLMLPDIDGYEVLRRLQAADVHTPVLIQTGLVDRREQARALGLDGDDYLIKPFSISELMGHMQALVGRPNNPIGHEQNSQGDAGGDQTSGRMEDYDRRDNPRLKTIKSGQIIYKNATSVMACTILNMSEGGATLQPADHFDCPETFTLRLRHGPTYRCEVCWQYGNKLGVRFLDA